MKHEEEFGFEQDEAVMTDNNRVIEIRDAIEVNEPVIEAVKPSLSERAKVWYHSHKQGVLGAVIGVAVMFAGVQVVEVFSHSNHRSNQMSHKQMSQMPNQQRPSR